MVATTAPTPTTGQEALDAALAAGFVITQHRALNDHYWHQLQHRDGRALSIDTTLGAGRFISAQGWHRDCWATTRLAVRSLPALRRLLAEGAPPTISAPGPIPADVHAVRQHDDVWQRIGPDEWLFIHADGDRICRHTHDTATVLTFGPVTAIPKARTAAQAERLTSGMAGHTVTVDLPGLGELRLTVHSTTGGFLVGVADRIGPYAVHLANAPEVLHPRPTA